MINIETGCCFTGYRPEKFDFPFDNQNPKYLQLVSRLLTGISKKLDYGCTDFYTGMARGFDILAAEQVATIKLKRTDVQLIAVLPYKDVAASLSADWKERFDRIIKQCDEVIVLNEKYGKWVFAERNEFMVDRCRHVICYYDGKNGGTKNTVNYAFRHSREVLNICETDPASDQKRNWKPFFCIFDPNKK